MNQTAGETVATTYAVDDRVDLIALALVELLAVVDHRFPAVERCAERFAQRAHYILETELFHHLLEDAFVALGIRLAAFYISIRLEAQAQLGVLFVAYTYVHIFHQRAHDADSLLRRPQFLAEVQVHAHAYAVTLGCLASQLGDLCGFVRDSRSDARPVEPSGTFHDLVKVEIFRVGFSYGAVSTIVDDLRRTHRRAGLAIVQTYAVAATNDVVVLYAVTTQRVDCYLTNLVLRQFGHKIGVMPVVGARDGHIGLAATRDDAEMIRLNKTVLSFWTQAKHYFAKGNDFCHLCLCS